MALSTPTYMSWNPGQLMQAIRERWIYAFPWLYDLGSLSVAGSSSPDGITLAFTIEPSGADPFTQYVTLVTASPEGGWPMEFLLDAPGFSGSWAARYIFGADFDPDLIAGIYESLLAETLGALIPIFTDGELDEISVKQKSSFEGKVVQYRATVSVSNDRQTRTFEDALMFYQPNEFSEGFSTPWLFNSPLPPVVGQTSMMVPTSDPDAIQRIAEALEDIATTSVEVSINHGAQMYSVYGKAITDDVP